MEMSKDFQKFKIKNNLKKSKKNHFFYLKILKIFFFLPKKIKIKAILLVLLIKEISLQRELSSPPHFRIQGGGGGRGTLSVTNGGRSPEIFVSNIGSMASLKVCQILYSYSFK